MHRQNELLLLGKALLIKRNIFIDEEKLILKMGASYYDSRKYLVLLLILCLVFAVSGCVKELPTVINMKELKIGTVLLEKEVVFVDQFSKRPLGDKRETVTKIYDWPYYDRIFHIALPLEMDVYQFYKERERERSFDLFATDPFDDSTISELVSLFRSIGFQYGLR